MLAKGAHKSRCWCHAGSGNDSQYVKVSCLPVVVVVKAMQRRRKVKGNSLRRHAEYNGYDDVRTCRPNKLEKKKVYGNCR